MDIVKHPETVRPTLMATSEQIEKFKQARNQKSERKQLRILVVEDRAFSQQLLCEVLRDTHSPANNAMPLIDAAPSIQRAWEDYLEKAYDIAFIDLSLPDGSGHILTYAIKKLDPSAFVVIVTASNFEEQLDVARLNHVDGFVVKPYDKKHIIRCVERYTALKAHDKRKIGRVGG